MSDIPGVHARITGNDGTWVEVDAYGIGLAEVCLEMSVPGGESVVEFFALPEARQIRDALSAAIAHQEGL